MRSAGCHSDCDLHVIHGVEGTTDREQHELSIRQTDNRVLDAGEHRSIIGGGGQETPASCVDEVDVTVCRDVPSDGSLDVGVQHSQNLSGIRIVDTQEAAIRHLYDVYWMVRIIPAATLFGCQGISRINHFQQSTGSIFFL